MPLRRPCSTATPRPLRAAVLPGLVLVVMAMGPGPAWAAQPVPARAAAAGRDAPNATRPEPVHAPGELWRAPAAPVPQAVNLARRVLLDACRRDPALRWHWLCQNEP
ncbi:hypothetical protein [Pseudorhodoferax sp.]|uniref:hypothetical protein n=1 Tax=Pseudorhodoferax sp. TaxID=1993553 RepID=UPI0039E69723